MMNQKDFKEVEALLEKVADLEEELATMREDAEKWRAITHSASARQAEPQRFYPDFDAGIMRESLHGAWVRYFAAPAPAAPADQVQPERREVCEVRDEHDQGGTWQNGYDTGWNECLDARKGGA